MRKIIGCLVLLFLSSNIIANEDLNSASANEPIKKLTESTSKKISYKAANCSAGFSQFFKITNAHPNDKQFILFLSSENFDVDSTLREIAEIHGKESKIFQNHFIATSPSDKAIYTGVLHLASIDLATKHASVETLCGLTFACKPTNQDGYLISIETNGVKCNLNDSAKQQGYYTVVANSDPH